MESDNNHIFASLPNQIFRGSGMNGFKRALFVVCMVSAALMAQVSTASAQMAPRRTFSGDRVGGGGYYYGYDPVIYPDINQTNAAYQQSWNQQREYQAQAANQRTEAWQNINQSLAQQASMQTQSMAAERQSSRDWWYQQQSRKLAESKSQGNYQPMVLPPSMFDAPAAEKPAQKEIMLWPTLLKSPEYDEYRAVVEAPFRRSLVDKKPLTADDYRYVLLGLERMKIKLEGQSLQIIESEYAAVESYLDELEADAKARLEQKLAAAKKKEEPAAKP
jgi:hypothetical protein